MAPQVDELRQFCSEVLQSEEAGKIYYLLKDLKLPPGCVPDKIDALLCPTERDGYPSRLYFAQQVVSPNRPNWTQPMRILDLTWAVYSWRLNVTGQTLAQVLVNHLRALQ
jgi:hypothetical protein